MKAKVTAAVIVLLLLVPVAMYLHDSGHGDDAVYVCKKQLTLDYRDNGEFDNPRPRPCVGFSDGEIHRFEIEIWISER